MPLAYTYSDPYLSPLATEARETRAIADLAEINLFSQEHLARLVPLRVYIIICLESVQRSDDAFSVKLAAYRREYDNALSLAKAETPDINGHPAALLSVEVERG